GALPYTDVVKLAFAMLRYGIAGKPNSKVWNRGDKQKAMDKFDPSELLGIAISQFGMQPESAWNLTMIEYQRAWEGKFPADKDKVDPPTKEEAEQTMAWARQQMEKAKTHGVVKQTGGRR